MLIYSYLPFCKWSWDECRRYIVPHLDNWEHTKPILFHRLSWRSRMSWSIHRRTWLKPRKLTRMYAIIHYTGSDIQTSSAMYIAYSITCDTERGCFGSGIKTIYPTLVLCLQYVWPVYPLPNLTCVSLDVAHSCSSAVAGSAPGEASTCSQEGWAGCKRKKNPTNAGWSRVVMVYIGGCRGTGGT